MNKEFSRIYSSSACAGDFGSCMVDRGHHYFYDNAIDASAAYLENKDGEIVARCIVYNNVYDEDGKIWRLAERQYSRGSDLKLKRALVDALIREKHIDGFKTIGAGCGDASSFEDIEGNSLSNKKFRIDCDLDCEDTLSYQDSFKWYDIDKRVAYNYPAAGADYGLDTTDLNLYGDYDEEDEEDEWDSYHQEYVSEVTTVYVNGREETCNVYALDDFHEIDGVYYHLDDVSRCDNCGNYYLDSESQHSRITSGDYCCEDCKEAAEQKYIEENWYYSDYDKTYFEDRKDLTTFLSWDWNVVNYTTKTISKQTLEKLSFYLFNGVYYDRLNPQTGLPYYVEETEEVAA